MLAFSLNTFLISVFSENFLVSVVSEEALTNFESFSENFRLTYPSIRLNLRKKI